MIHEFAKDPTWNAWTKLALALHNNGIDMKWIVVLTKYESKCRNQK
jgi:hypothetical protein